jgi:hypothetical protein
MYDADSLHHLMRDLTAFIKTLFGQLQTIWFPFQQIAHSAMSALGGQVMRKRLP